MTVGILHPTLAIVALSSCPNQAWVNLEEENQRRYPNSLCFVVEEAAPTPRFLSILHPIFGCTPYTLTYSGDMAFHLCPLTFHGLVIFLNAYLLFPLVLAMVKIRLYQPLASMLLQTNFKLFSASFADRLVISFFS